MGTGARPWAGGNTPGASGPTGPAVLSTIICVCYKPVKGLLLPLSHSYI